MDPTRSLPPEVSPTDDDKYLSTGDASQAIHTSTTAVSGPRRIEQDDKSANDETGAARNADIEAAAWMFGKLTDKAVQRPPPGLNVKNTVSQHYVQQNAEFTKNPLQARLASQGEELSRVRIDRENRDREMMRMQELIRIESIKNQKLERKGRESFLRHPNHCWRTNRRRIP